LGAVNVVYRGRQVESKRRTGGRGQSQTTPVTRGKVKREATRYAGQGRITIQCETSWQRKSGDGDKMKHSESRSDQRERDTVQKWQTLRGCARV